MKIVFSEEGWEDYLHWVDTDRKLLRRINRLIRETCRDPFQGLGKPGPLRHLLEGHWSRRITGEHRMVYRVEAETLLLLQLRYHYED